MRHRDVCCCDRRDGFKGDVEHPAGAEEKQTKNEIEEKSKLYTKSSFELALYCAIQ